MRPRGRSSPTYRRKETANKLSAFSEALVLALKADAHRTKQNRRTAKALFAQIKAQGYIGGYSRVTAFIRAWREVQGKAPKAFVPLQFEPGEAFQFDWSDEMLFDAHTRSFTALGGIARRGIYDNMKAAVDKVKKGKGRVVNARFTSMCAHYLFDTDFCNVASGWEKGVVEKNVQDSRRRIWLDAQKIQWGVAGGVLQVVDRVPAASRAHGPGDALHQPPDENGQVPDPS